MISISAPVFDLMGNIIINPLESSNLEDIDRRVNRIKTLDGGAVANDAGYSVADRTFNIVWLIENDQYENIKRMTQLYPRLLVITKEGAFSAIPQRLIRRTASEANLTLLVMKKLSI